MWATVQRHACAAGSTKTSIDNSLCESLKGIRPNRSAKHHQIFRSHVTAPSHRHGSLRQRCNQSNHLARCLHGEVANGFFMFFPTINENISCRYIVSYIYIYIHILYTYIYIYTYIYTYIYIYTHIIYIYILYIIYSTYTAEEKSGVKINHDWW